MTRDDNHQFILPAISVRFVQVSRVPRPNIPPPPPSYVVIPQNATDLHPFYRYPDGHILDLVRDSFRVRLESTGAQQPIPRIADQPLPRTDEHPRFIVEQPRLPEFRDEEIPRFRLNGTRRRAGADFLRARRIG